MAPWSFRVRPLVPIAPWDMTIVHCDPEGEPMGALQIGPVQLVGGMDVLTTDDGGVLVCGRFNDRSWW